MWFRTHRKNGAAAHAVKEAREALEQIQERNPLVAEVSREIRYYRVRNHFGERVDAMVQRRIERG